MSTRHVEAHSPPHAAEAVRASSQSPAHPAAAIDSGIDVGSSSEFDQDNSAAGLALVAHDDTSEASTDEG